ncbi:SRPBCC family protein [Herbidospora cretacea]|uniref:SRPBCC family protein n=1 Tax=Herbidospora cretacea TaxID=28444 RepID=UPI00077302E8|nr:SRPBCC family protein [Herbidospora cretacea]
MQLSNSARWPVARIAAVAVGFAAVVTGCGPGDDASRARSSAAAPAAESPAGSSAESSAGSSVKAAPGKGETCDGMGIDLEAPVTSSSEIVINAPLRKVWETHVDVEGWAGWQKAIATIERLDPGPLSDTSRFRWTTPVPESKFSPADTLSITSSVKGLEEGECVIWQGPAIGKAISIEKGVHLWKFTEKDGVTHVHTEESWEAAFLDSLKGPDFDAVAAMLGGGLDLWLQDLKAKVEGSTAGN